MEASNFFSRLLKQPKSGAQLVEVDDIGEFDKAWRAIQDTLEHPDERQLLKGIQSTEVPRLLTHIVDALVHESNQIDEETLGGCMEYFVNNDLLANLERLCERDKPHGIKSEVLRALNNLIVLLPDKFLVHNSVHRPLRRLLKSCIGDDVQEGETHGSAKTLGAGGVDFRGDVEGDLVDLMCVLCSRMRAYPPLLLIFFHDKGWLQPNPNSTPTISTHSRTRSLSKAPSTISQNFEFLLFSYLLRFIHREGKTGDFARAGLLFLFDIAFPSEKESTTTKYDDSLVDAERALAGYILDGDFVDVMAAGLGAVWSLLPSKLKVPGLGEDASDEEDLGAGSGGMVLGAHEGERHEEEEMRMSTDEDVRNQIGMLLKLFGYIQDILDRREIDLQTIDMDAYETESDHSEAEEPSISRIWSALVTSSLDAIQSSFLENVLYPSILECSPQDGSSVAIMTYLDVLFSNMDDGNLLTLLTDYLLCRGKYASESEDRFTLKDLIFDNINSGNAGAVTAGLRLLGTMMGGHCDIATESLLSTISPGYTSDTRQPIPNSNELELFASLVERLDHTQSSLEYSSSYASYLTDTHACIQNDKCFQLYQLFQSSEKHSSPIGKHRLEAHNVMLQTFLGSLGQFLCRGVDENVALTGVLVTMAICPFRSLEGWLTFEQDPWAAHNDHTESRTKTEERPAIYRILSNLVSQIATFRSQIPNFDNLLAERRSGLLYTENIDEAMNVMLDVQPSNIFGPTMPITPTPKKKGMMGTLASYLTPTRASPSPSPAPTTPLQPRVDNLTTTTNSYKMHYDSLAGKEVEAVPSPIGKSYTSAMLINRSTSSQNTTSTGNEESGSATYGTTQRAGNKDAGEGGGRKMSLNTTLDNCIILEEFIKELVAIISARRALGIDSVSFS